MRFINYIVLYSFIYSITACTPDIIVEPTPVIVNGACCCDAGLTNTVYADMNTHTALDMNIHTALDMNTHTPLDMNTHTPDMMMRCVFDPAGPIEISECTAEIDAIKIDPVIEWAWPFDDQSDVVNVIMTPVIGDIDRDGTPDIVFSAYNHDGSVSKIVALAGDGSRELWSFSSVQDYQGMTYDVPIEDPTGVVNPVTAAGVALGDIDNDGAPDVCFAGETNQAMVICVEGFDGSFKWASPPGANGEDYSWASPAIANIDGQGEAEVILADHIFKGIDGSLFAKPNIRRGIATFANNVTNKRLSSISIPIDLDQDGIQELVSGKTIYYYDNTNILKVLFDDTFPDGFPAVADLDLDGRPEIVRTAHTPNMGSKLIIVDWDSNQGWHSEAIPLALPDTLPRTFGGPPTIADFDSTPNSSGINYPEIAVAGSEFYQVYEVNVTVNDSISFEYDITLDYKWSPAVSNYDSSSSSTGSSVFDFEGDGKSEVIYADQNQLFILDGPTGSNRINSSTLFDASDHCSGTLTEYPVIVDADGDGQTEIVITSNHGRANGSDLYVRDCDENRDWQGIRVISSIKDDWVFSRQVWNQHAYNISNVNDDLSIPNAPAQNWLIWNNFRTADSSQSPIKFRPDLVAMEPQVCCENNVALVVINFGNGSTQDVTESFTVGVHDPNSGILLYQQRIQSLASGMTQQIGPFSLTQNQWMNSIIEVRVDDTPVANVTHGEIIECYEDNNMITIGEWPCE